MGRGGWEGRERGKENIGNSIKEWCNHPCTGIRKQLFRIGSKRRGENQASAGGRKETNRLQRLLRDSFETFHFSSPVYSSPSTFAFPPLFRIRPRPQSLPILLFFSLFLLLNFQFYRSLGLNSISRIEFDIKINLKIRSKSADAATSNRRFGSRSKEEEEERG